MGLKNTKIWKYLKIKRGKILLAKKYRENKKMPCKKYEEYLIKRTYEMMNRYEYSKKDAFFINFDNPQTFTEKLQWLKLYDQSVEKTKLTDKYEVRSFVAEKIGSEHLIPLISIGNSLVFCRVKDIDFKLLPDSFVIKCTHGSHMNIIVKNKNDLSNRDIAKIKIQLKKWLKINYAFYVGLELQYLNIEPRIIIEKYIDCGEEQLKDYKFFCFDGEVKFLSVNENRGTKDYSETYFDLNFSRLPFSLGYYKENDNVKKPNKLSEMISISKQLCSGFKYVRVDLYEVEGKIYFGELTFSPGAGFDFPKPMSFDKTLGELFSVENKMRENNFLYRDEK